MKVKNFSSNLKLDDQKRLLALGPLPPPVGGATVSFQGFLEEVNKHTSIRLSVIDIRSPTTYREHKFLFGLESLRRAAIILGQHLKKIRNCDAVLIYGNNPFNLTVVPVLLMLARLFKKRLYLHPNGGDLDLFVASKNKLIQNYFITVLSKIDGIIAETQQLQNQLSEFGCDNAVYVPNCRSSLQVEPTPAKNSKLCRLVFFSQIKREKGPLILLEALRLIAREDDINVTCDFYGPIFNDVEQEFLVKLEQTPNANYCGVAEVGTASDIIRTYDALVLPTYFKSEGHPGVIIEAMQAGVPIISTNHRAIPELITDGDNGLLVPKQDSRALAEAIKKIALDPSLRQRMGMSSYQKGQDFRADKVVPQVLQVIFPEQ